MPAPRVCRPPSGPHDVPWAPPTLTSTSALAAATGAAALLLAATLAAQVPTGGSYSLPRQVIGAGGERATGGSYVLVDTIGQAATGPASGSAYTIQQGFHAAAAAGPLPDLMFRNGFE